MMKVVGVNEGEQPFTNGVEPDIEAIKAALSSDNVLDAALRLDYARKLLAYALETRDAEAGGLVARLMDADPALDSVLDSALNDALHDQPDIVYSFVRARVAENLNPRWLFRLKVAAVYSMRVAINDAGSCETIINWLTLLAREPATYELTDVLHFGILAAQEQTHTDPDLARALVLLAAKRDPVVIDTLLNDPALLEALPNNIGRVLRDFDGDPMVLFQNKGAEIFLIGMARAARAGVGAMFVPANLGKIWDLYIGLQPINPMLPAHYQPASIVQVWLENGAAFLSMESLEMLATLALRSRQDDLFLGLLHQEDGAKALFLRLIYILEHSERTINDAIDLIGRVVLAGDMSPGQAAILYITMLDGLEWRREALPLVQQVARTLNQFPNIELRSEALWHMLNLGAEVKDELIVKVATKRLVHTLEATEDDVQFVENLRRLAAQTAWSETLRSYATNWWRGFIRGQPIARLSRLDKALDGKRSLEEERSVLHTLTGLRKMLGGRTLKEFASDIRAAYTVLEALGESFDPSTKRSGQFDAQIMRAELDAREDQISPQERQILANNLKELAQIIAAMGDNRTRANLIRRGDDLDRDLMSGEQKPHSAVDAMKWLSGYWGGTQEDGEGDA